MATKVERTVMGSGLAGMAKALEEIDKLKLIVGWFSAQRYDDKAHTQVAAVAAQNEYGNAVKGIPPRPFIRPTMAEQKQQWALIFADLSKKIMQDKITAEQALETLGLIAAGDIRKTIANLWTPALAQSTIDARKRKRADGNTTGSLNKPLVDQGIMINSLTHVVSKK
ncbi:MAG: hypothetical protein GY886_08485 [Gammaproteobacteria bacterium]|nr:hypothetical protein [Gammaproteobacteria bacterium]MCP4832231.1 hypothetical protein [Gammaproteobacteria bacterium]